jgi:sialate O-acetylesterase
MRKYNYLWFIGLLFLWGNHPTQAALELPALIGDHMVFQSGVSAVVWGKDLPGQKVFVSIDGLSGATQADRNGRWKVLLPALPIGGPYELSITGSSMVKIQDVLVGEVWLGSGQSNMEFRIDQTRDAKKTIAQANEPQIRLFLQKPVMSAKPLDSPEGEWKVCSSASVGNFSAVAYHFGLNLRNALKVPVGLIAASWGGSYAESWTPGEVLGSNPSLHQVLKRWKTHPLPERNLWLKGRFGVDLAVKNLRLIPRDPSQAPLALKANGVSPTLGDTQAPGQWGWGVKDGSSLSVSLTAEGPRMKGDFLTDAWGWMTIPLSPDAKPFDLGPYESVEFDARGDGKYILFLSQPSVTDWDNYRTAESFPISKQWKHYRIDFASLKQSGWGKAQAFTPSSVSNLFFGVDPKPLIDVPSALYNGMIHPLTPFPIKGVIWYQGEANAIRPDEYGGLLSAMIGGWRKAWGQPDMPFLLAQLPNYLPRPGQGQNQWSDLREQQRQVGGEPYNAMAVLIDLGEPHDIHPKAKAPAGSRLAQQALSLAYGRVGVPLSPLYDKAVPEGSKIRVYFKNTGEGLESKGGDLRGFEIAGPDGRFEAAKARIEKGTVLAWNDDIAQPRMVRYAWGDNPDFNLYGKNGLPASPFKEDKLQ